MKVIDFLTLTITLFMTCAVNKGNKQFLIKYILAHKVFTFNFYETPLKCPLLLNNVYYWTLIITCPQLQYVLA